MSLLTDANPQAADNSTVVVTRFTFNENATSFTAATSHGFLSYTTEPFTLQLCSQIGAVQFVVPVELSNYFILVGSGPRSALQGSQVLILWDEASRSIVKDCVLTDAVKDVRVVGTHFIALTTSGNVAFGPILPNFEIQWSSTLTVRHVALTMSHMVTVSFDDETKKEFIRVRPTKTPEEAGEAGTGDSGEGCKEVTFNSGHRHEIRTIAISPDGKYVATTSLNGTVVHVTDLTSSVPSSRELRRAITAAQIESISFSADNLYVVAAGSHGISLWYLGPETENTSWFRWMTVPGSACDHYQHDKACSNQRCIASFGASGETLKVLYQGGHMAVLKVVQGKLEQQKLYHVTSPEMPA
eukprot:PhF_6_TR13229/c0_g1_i1/m.20926